MFDLQHLSGSGGSLRNSQFTDFKYTREIVLLVLGGLSSKKKGNDTLASVKDKGKEVLCLLCGIETSYQCYITADTAYHQWVEVIELPQG